MKLTPWYPATVKPVRVGWYEIGTWFADGIRLFWNGKEWGIVKNGKWYGHIYQRYTWRGLTRRTKSRA